MKGTDTDSVSRPLADAQTIADVEAFNWPSGSDWDFAELRARLLADSTHARLSPSWMPVFSRLCELFGPAVTNGARDGLAVHEPASDRGGAGPPGRVLDRVLPEPARDLR
ncbi:MAG: hypothetical protein HYY04_16680 [Chloroflexi bacterium]|nr:hypothetical protein [Chloroflexota bacterium]